MVSIGQQAPNYQASPSQGNDITSRVGSSFAVIPNVFAFTDACGAPPLPQKMHIVPAPLPIDSPLAAKQISVNVTNAHAQNPSAIQSFIPQSLCCGFGSRGLLADQTFNDATGNPMFSFKMVTPCCQHPRVTSFGPNQQEIGHLQWNRTPCGMVCAMAMCACICRTATLPEHAYLSAVDAKGQEKLTFRTAAQEGKCVLFDHCCASTTHTQHGCCAVPPDMPFLEHRTIYGPMGEGQPIGSINVRGAYGYDKACGCLREFGVRPELAVQYQLNKQLTTEDVSHTNNIERVD